MFRNFLNLLVTIYVSTCGVGLSSVHAYTGHVHAGVGYNIIGVWLELVMHCGMFMQLHHHHCAMIPPPPPNKSPLIRALVYVCACIHSADIANNTDGPIETPTDPGNSTAFTLTFNFPLLLGLLFLPLLFE